MRTWVALREAGIPFTETMVKLDTEAWRARVPIHTPSGRVPVLWIDDEPVWDSLAILEAVAELHPEAGLWPADPRARRFARSICAEMHAGFGELRARMPMNIRASLPGKGHTEAALRDVARVTALWTEARARFGAGGAMLLGRFSNADAMYAPVVMRFATYGVPLTGAAAEYAAAVRELASVRAWNDDAVRETEFVAEDEPYVNAAP